MGDKTRDLEISEDYYDFKHAIHLPKTAEISQKIWNLK